MGLDNKNISGVDDMLAKLQAAKRYLQNDVFTVVGVEAVNHFKANFQKEGFDDKNVEKWKPRRTKRMGGTNSQKVMTKTGDTAESIDWRKDGNIVIVYSDKAWAQIHNEGGQIAVTAKMRKYFWAMHYQAKNGNNPEVADQFKAMALAKVVVMPQRKFMGNSENLNNNIIEKIKRDLTRILS